jgi:cell division protein FtsL
MAQKKKKKPQVPKKNHKRISRSQRIMVIIGVFIIIAMLLPSLLYFFK